MPAGKLDLMFALVPRRRLALTTYNVIRTRNVGRNRARARIKYEWDDEVIARDERLLANLEKKLAEAKARMAQEEKQNSSFFGRLFARGERKKSQAEGIGEIEEFELMGDHKEFWNELLPIKEREQLAAEGITSLSELYAASHEAEKLMGPPDFVSYGELTNKHRLARRTHKNIPRYLARAAGAEEEDIHRITSG